MKNFTDIHDEAILRLGGDEAVNNRLPSPDSPASLRRKSDACYLAEMSRRIFRAGLKHSMVDARWPAFESVFHSFDTDRVRLMSDEQLEKLMHDKRIIRHWAKIKAVRNNAEAIYRLSQTHGSMGNYLADWPLEGIIDLWAELRREFTQLGGMSGPYFLRMVGKDTFLLTDYVCKALQKWAGIDCKPSTRKALLEAQQCMCQWREESDRPLCQVSMILALSVD